MLNVSFYKFIEIKNLENLKIKILNFMKKEDIKGKILLANEGINGAYTLEEKSNERFEKFLEDLFKTDFFFKKTKCSNHHFKRTLVKVRKEIITFKKDFNIEKTGKYIEPKMLENWYKNKEDFVIVDHRNDYEFDVGHFENSINLNIKEFTDFPKAINKIKDKIKDKKIVNFCTGGVRCEKSTAWMVENGFGDNVYQVKGGIINYGKECSDNFWVGKCFVFDNRGAIEIDENKQNDDYTKCKVCRIPEDKKRYCEISKKEFIMCDKCYKLMDGCYDKFFRNEKRKKLLV